ncbi:MAG TPA: LacI family DNA-binding transcriptional regulator [Candidatus Deferrimicrobiaceae bacterium]|nr:LacI family DNA-binding transcriptional regulator [Candidatus Deferrimicrobiaceae bacterium]
MERRTHRPRIADVARVAGVSKTAVSFAFNNPARLSPETAVRIREVAETLGYRPHPVARMLAQRRTMTLGVLTPQALSVIFSNPFFALFNEGVARAAEERGYGLHFISPILGSLATAIGRASVDGVVAIGLSAEHPEVGQIRSAGLPMVLVDSEDLPEHGSVVVDDEGGAGAAAAHLLELGHRNVLILTVEAAHAGRDGGPSGSGERRSARGQPDALDVTTRRLRGYELAFESAGLPIDPAWIIAGRASIDGGTLAFQRAWALSLRPTAVLAMSDAMAIGVIRAARDLDLRVPDDLSVVGFDDIDLAANVDPALTTVHQPIRQKGYEAVRLLLEDVEQGTSPVRHLRLDTRLIVRGSTAPPRAGREVPATPA